jgi:toxin-antitoxin system PIN domain toxin
VRSLFGVSFLLALFDTGHVQHTPATRWWSDNRTEGWASCPITQNGFVRIVSQASYPNATSPGIALVLLAAQIKDSDHEFWPDDISLTELERFNHENILGPKQITDIYLLALAVRNRGRLVTLDRSISTTAVRDATQANLVVLG